MRTCCNPTEVPNFCIGLFWFHSSLQVIVFFTRLTLYIFTCLQLPLSLIFDCFTFYQIGLFDETLFSTFKFEVLLFVRLLYGNIL